MATVVAAVEVAVAAEDIVVAMVEAVVETIELVVAVTLPETTILMMTKTMKKTVQVLVPSSLTKMMLTKKRMEKGERQRT